MNGSGATSPPPRAERALIAFVRQEFDAPVAAIIGFAEILLEDARRNDLATIVPDLERIRDAGLALQTLVGELLDVGPAAAGVGLDAPGRRDQLRHDLRTPLNAVKGYGEMVMEEARDGGRASLGHDVGKLLQAADKMLSQIDAMIGLAAGLGAPNGDAAFAATASSHNVVDRIMGSIQPLSTWEREGHSVASRILVVDDNAANRDLLTRRLAREGHLVEAVEDGRSALKQVASDHFDLVLLDLMMPEMNGFEVLCRMKADPALRDVPVIMISALDEIDSIVRCIEAGAEDYLPKPFNPVLLRARINAALEKKRLRDREHAFTRQLQTEKDKSEILLLHILPKSVVARMRQGETAIADGFTEVTILFSDLVGFTRLASVMPPAQVVELLNHLFTEFDRLAFERGLEKIKTIGDAYMVAGGLPEPRDDHAVAVADMALHMIDVVAAAGTMLGRPLQVRIGIHSGAAVAGIIGKHKFIYDVWGDTVNTANRMESHGVPDRVQISAATYHRVRDTFRCEPRGPQEVKGKGMMETYFLLSRRSPG
jgi:class 3 adenylate cyclase/CheY-like chemotaxis protein